MYIEKFWWVDIYIYNNYIVYINMTNKHSSLKKGMEELELRNNTSKKQQEKNKNYHRQQDKVKGYRKQEEFGPKKFIKP